MINKIKYNRTVSRFNNFLYKCNIPIHSYVNICCTYNAMNIYSYSYLSRVLLLYNVDISQMSERYNIDKKNIAILISEHFSKLSDIKLSDIEINIYTPNTIYELFEYDKGNKIQKTS